MVFATVAPMGLAIRAFASHSGAVSVRLDWLVASVVLWISYVCLSGFIPIDAMLMYAGK